MISKAPSPLMLTETQTPLCPLLIDAKPCWLLCSHITFNHFIRAFNDRASCSRRAGSKAETLLRSHPPGSHFSPGPSVSLHILLCLGPGSPSRPLRWLWKQVDSAPPPCPSKSLTLGTHEEERRPGLPCWEEE